jgi:hypothetical protein
MTFDPVKAFIDSKKKFAAARGEHVISYSSHYPLTTTLDVFTFSRDFYDANQKSEDGFLEKAAKGLAIIGGAGPTNDYFKATAAWKATWPSAFEAMTKPYEPYWNNQKFWEMGSRFSISRSAVGSVPGHWDMLVESVKESAGDLLKKVMPRIDWTKWIIYGVGGYVIYTAVTERAKQVGRGG